MPSWAEGTISFFQVTISKGPGPIILTSSPWSVACGPAGPVSAGPAGRPGAFACKLSRCSATAGILLPHCPGPLLTAAPASDPAGRIGFTWAPPRVTECNTLLQSLLYSLLLTGRHAGVLWSFLQLLLDWLHYTELFVHDTLHKDLLDTRCVGRHFIIWSQ